MSNEIYAIHRSWWPGLTDAEADGILDNHLKALAGENPVARLEHIILSLKNEHASEDIKRPGKVVEHRVKHANSRARAGGAEATPFKSWEPLGNVGLGGKVTGADANDILAAAAGSDRETVRRLIREVCGKWAGPNGKDRSTQHVVAEVIRLLRPSNGATQGEQPAEAIRVRKLTKEDAAKLAALGKQMTSPRPRTGA